MASSNCLHVPKHLVVIPEVSGNPKRSRVLITKSDFSISISISARLHHDFASAITNFSHTQKLPLSQYSPDIVDALLAEALHQQRPGLGNGLKNDAQEQLLHWLVQVQTKPQQTFPAPLSNHRTRIRHTGELSGTTVDLPVCASHAFPRFITLW